MTLPDDIEQAVAPIRAIAERLSALERDAIDAALYDVKLIAVHEEGQKNAVANEFMETMVELEDAQEELREMSGRGPAPTTTKTPTPDRPLNPSDTQESQGEQ